MAKGPLPSAGAGPFVQLNALLLNVMAHTHARARLADRARDRDRGRCPVPACPCRCRALPPVPPGREGARWVTVLTVEVLSPGAGRLAAGGCASLALGLLPVPAGGHGL
jgi:hypothetical protein